MELTEQRDKKEIIVLELAGKGEMPEERLQHYFTHILCHGGTARFRMESRHYQLKPHHMAICLPSVGIKDLSCSRSFRATCLFVSYELMSRNNPDIGWGIKGYLFSKENPVVHLSEADIEQCLHSFELLRERYEDDAHRFREELVNLQLQMFIMEMWNIFSREIDKRSVTNQKGSLRAVFAVEYRSTAWRNGG